MNINECGCRPYEWLGLDGDRCIRVIPRHKTRVPVAPQKILMFSKKLRKNVQYKKQTVKLSNEIEEQYLSMCEASGKTPKEVSMVQGKSSKQKIFAFVE